MLTITIIFALLVGLWGSTGATAMFARRRAAHASSQPGDDGASQPRTARSTASAGR